MTETKFTPGPWEISHQNGDPEELFNGIIGPAQTNRLGKTYRTYVAQYVEPKNAHLISAAPELYDALDHVHKLIVKGAEHGFTDHDWMDELFTSQSVRYQALKKARGEV